jgi:DNA-binding PadR family transcriptional regulator
MFHRHFFESERYSRLFDKGDFKYVILNLLKDKPCHGYEIIRVLEEQFHGLYSPSAGSIYPTLQLLEDMEYVCSTERDGKKIYTITESGKDFLSKHQETIDRIKAHIDRWGGSISHEQFRSTMRDLRNIGRMFVAEVHHGEPDKIEDIRQIIARSCKDVEAIANR